MIQARKRSQHRTQRGMTLLELIIATSMLLILASAAVPMVRVTVKRQKEVELHRMLREMRDAIDRYKDVADRNLIQIELGTEGYPKSLQILVDGVDLAGAPGRHIRFLRQIPTDPMTGRAEWGQRSVQDDPKANSWGGQNVFDVFSKSAGQGLDGTFYKDW